MKIIYVMPVYNSQNTIAQCIRSLLNQTHEDFELIVINDGSEDNTDRIIKTFDSNKLTYVSHKKRAGSAKRRNEGNKLALEKGCDIIAVCDSDIYYDNRGAAIDAFFETNEDKQVFYSGLNLRSANYPGEVSEMGAYEWDFKSKCPISHPTVAYLSEVAKKVFYKEKTKDSDLYEFFLLDANKEGFKFGGCQDPLMVKIEGNSKRDVKKARKEYKESLYKEYGIEVSL